MAFLRGWHVSRQRWLAAGFLSLFSLISVALLLGWSAWRKASGSLAAAREATEQSLPCEVGPFRSRSVPEGWRAYAAPVQFRRAVRFQGELYVAGAGGLGRYRSEGAPVVWYRPGVELPASPVIDLTVVRLRRSGPPVLALLTRDEGVLLFDGTAFEQVRPKAAGLRQIQVLWPLASGVLLLGTEHDGVLAFDGEGLRPFLPGWTHGPVTALAGDEGALLIGTREHGLFARTGGTLAEVTGLPDARVLSLWSERDTAWAGTPLGVSEVRDGKVVRTVAEGKFARAVGKAGDDVWVATVDEGLVAVGTKRRTIAGDTVRDEVESFFSDGAELLAVSTQRVRRWGARGWETVVQAPEAMLADRNIAALAVEASGRWWVGYFDQGLDRFDQGRTQAVHFLTDQLFCVNRVVASDDGRRVVAGTANGLVLFDAAGQPREVLDRGAGLLNQQVSDVLLDGPRMIAATGSGITIFDASGVRSLSAFQNLVNNHVYALGLGQGELLAGTLGGLSRLQQDVVQVSYTTGNSALKNNWITALAPLGKDWLVGTYGAGVMRLRERGTWESFADLPKGLVVNTGAMVTTARTVYVGTLGEGLWSFEKSTQRWRRMPDAGLPSRNVTALAVGGGQLWIGTENGLVSVPEGRAE